jgi:hypothetical protein
LRGDPTSHWLGTAPCQQGTHAYCDFPTASESSKPGCLFHAGVIDTEGFANALGIED